MNPTVKINVSGPKEWESTVTNTYSVKAVTRYEVVMRRHSNRVGEMYFGMGTVVCQCVSEREAEQIARSLAGKRPE